MGVFFEFDVVVVLMERNDVSWKSVVFFEKSNSFEVAGNVAEIGYLQINITGYMPIN